MDKIEVIDSNVLSLDVRGKYHPAVGAFGTELCNYSYDKPDWEGRQGSIKRFQELNWTEIKFIENTNTDTQVYVLSNDTAIGIIFRGTSNDIDWANNFKFHKSDTRFVNCKNKKEKRALKKKLKEQLKKENKTTSLGRKKGRAHQGHYKCMISVANLIIEYVKSIPEWESKDIYSWGHSLGGSIVCHFFGYTDHIFNFEMAYAIAPSLCGDRKYVKYLNKKAKGRLIAIENNTDIVCKVPLHIMGYRRLKKYVYIDSSGKVHKKINFFFKGIDLAWGLIQAPFTKKKGPVDDHHPAHYYNPQAKACGSKQRLQVWEEYRK